MLIVVVQWQCVQISVRENRVFIGRCSKAWPLFALVGGWPNTERGRVLVVHAGEGRAVQPEVSECN